MEQTVDHLIRIPLTAYSSTQPKTAVADTDWVSKNFEIELGTTNKTYQ